MHHVKELTAAKILIYHAKDDPYIPWRSVSDFAAAAGIRLRLLTRGGHLKTEDIVRNHWNQVKRFFEG